MNIEERCTMITVTIPLNILEELDIVRGDVPRSRFLTRLVRNVLEGGKKK